MKYKQTKLQKSIRDHLPKYAHSDLKQVQTSFDIIEREDSERIFSIYLAASVRGTARGAMQRYLIERHNKQLEFILADAELEPGDEAQYVAADKQLNQVYQEQKEYLKSYRDTERSYTKAEEHPRVDTSYELRLQNLKQAQLAWIKYRDAWVEVFLAYPHKNPRSRQEMKWAAQTFLTKKRIEELQHDPLSSP